MFGIDSPELLVIAVVALVVIGPKELPGLLKTWGRWMAQMRGMASEFRGHVDEMVRQSELDQVKQQLLDSTGGLDFKSLDPTKEMRATIQEGMSEGEKALAEAKSSLDSAPAQPVADPLAEPESAPQIAVDTALEALPEPTTEPPTTETPTEPPPAAPEALAEVVHKAEADDKPKAAAAG